MKSNKIINSYFICASQYSNLGDLMINKMLIDELCNYGTVYVDAIGVPEDFKQPLLENKNTKDISCFNFSVKRLSINNLLKFTYFLKKNNVKLVTRSPGPLCDSSPKISIGFKLINMLAHACDVKVIYFGNCCSEALVKNTRLKINNVNEVYVRSQQSVEYASKFINCPISYIPDMAFLMTSEKQYEKNKTVIIDYRTVSVDAQKSIVDLKNIVHDFRCSGYKVELYYQVKTDKEEVLSLYEQLKDEGVTMRKDLLWYDEIESFYSDKAFIVSNRLHSLLFGAAYGVIPIARITDETKVAKISHVFQSSFPAILYQNLMIDSPISIKSLIENENSYYNTLIKYMKLNKKKCSAIINKAVNFIA